MKYKTALKQSQASVRFLGAVLVILVLLVIKYPGKATWIPLILVAGYWAGDVYNIYRIKRRAAQDPTYLEQKLR